MQLSAVFQVSIYGLASLSGVMLAMAEGGMNPQGLTLPVALFAFIFCERWKVLRVSIFWANVLGGLAFLAAGAEFLSHTVEARLLSGAHLLVYLSWIVLFQKKTSKQYWFMCALGVLQVAVGSVLTNAVFYGFLLIGYLFFAIWTLSVFSLYLAQRRFTSPERYAVSTAEVTQPNGRRRRHSRPQAHRGGVTATTWPLRRASRTRGTIQHDPHEPWISLRFVGGAFVTAAASLSIAALLFLFIPRVWIGRPSTTPTDDRPGSTRPLTGFTDEVRLGDIGEILESTERVLEIRLFDNDTGTPIDVTEYAAQLGYEEPLFRGAVLWEYQDGHWSRSREGGFSTISALRPGPGMVRQKIHLEPIGTPILFAIHPVYACRFESSPATVVRDGISSVIYVRQRSQPTAGLSRKTLQYTAFSPKPSTAGSVQGTPAGRSSFLRPFARQRYLQLPGNSLERLMALSRQVTAPDAGGRRRSQAEQADRLVRYLRDSGRFSYSLDTSIEDTAVDPVEDFLFNRQTGHCEYYASALALMLRSVGIPARLISGFKGGTTNRISGFFEVEQRHAHAWVEAYIDRQWIVLDATPAAARSESVASMADRIAPFHELRNLLTGLWSSYVINMEYGQQKRMLYDPLSQLAENSWESVSGDRAAPSSIAGSIKDFLGSPTRWLSWQGGVAVFVLILLLSFFVWLRRRTARVWKRLAERLHIHTNRDQVRVDFYERFRKICAARGLVRGNTQTQREFAHLVSQSLNERLQSFGLSAFPLDLAESFYQVRFGAGQLDAMQAAEMHRRLDRLEQCLSHSAKQPAASK